MTEQSCSVENVVEFFSGKAVGGFLRRHALKKQLNTFLREEEYAGFALRQFPDGTKNLEQMIPRSDGHVSLDIACKYVRVRTGPLSLSLSITGLKDEKGVECDLILDGIWRIVDPRSLVNSLYVNGASLGGRLAANELQALLVDRLGTFVKDEVRRHPFAFLKDKDGLPAQWWEARLVEREDIPGLSLQRVRRVQWESASFERAEEARKRQELLAFREQEERREKEAELRWKAMHAKYEKSKREVETNREISKAEQEARLEELERNRQKEKLQSELDLETMRLEAEKRKAGLEHEIAQLRNDATAVAAVQERLEASERRHEEVVGALHEAQGELAKLASLLRPTVEALVAGGVGDVRLNASRLGAYAAEVSSSTLEILGEGSEVQYLAQVFREKAQADGQSILLKKLELRTRDIGATKVKALPVGSPLQFEFVSSRDGYATILNMGTSGATWLQSPNAYTKPGRTRIAENARCQIPGCILLPWEDLHKNELDYKEIGPPGWEDLAVIVSDEPIVDSEVVSRSRPDQPFVRLEEEDLNLLEDKLASLDPASWTVGVLSFLVE